MIQTAREDEIDRLAKTLKVLQVEYEKFFNGALDIPPGEEHAKLSKAIRRLRGRKQMTSVDRFRLMQLESRFNSYSELFNRRLRHKEEVGRAAVQSKAENAAKATARNGVVVRDKLAPRDVEALYGELASGNNQGSFDLESFRVYLSRQAGEIRRKTGCREVRFRVVEEGGRTKLKAKPIREAQADSAG